MDSQIMADNFNFSSRQQPIFNVLEAPGRCRPFAQGHRDSAPFMDVSFSSYLKPKEASGDIKEKEGVGAGDDTEISIFDAQKYFSETNDTKDVKKQLQPSQDLVSVPRVSSVSSADGYGRNYRTRSFYATPTASSEASWNSQTGLLANPPGSMAVSLRNFPSDLNSKKRNSNSKKWSFGRKCCCTGKYAVQVKEAPSDSENKASPVTANNDANSNCSYPKRDQSQKVPILESQTPQKLNPLRLTEPPRQQRVLASGRPFGDPTGAAFSFPILNSSVKSARPGFKPAMAKPVVNPPEDPPRESLEVFNPGSPMGRAGNLDDDMYSDASSDLFEIESFSTQTTSYQMSRGRDSLDEAPTFNPRRFGLVTSNNPYGRRSVDEHEPASECYAPSEVSIDWSVTTAEGFDKASVTNFSISASEIGNMAFLRQRIQEERCGGEPGKKKGNGLLLMSCRQEKAVSVGPEPVKCMAQEGVAAHVGGRGPPRANKPPIEGSHAARLSVAFAA